MAQRLNRERKDVTKSVADCIERRNAIVHKADRKLDEAGLEKQDIGYAWTRQAVDTIGHVCLAFDELVTARMSQFREALNAPGTQIMPDLRTFTLSARAKLSGETENLLLEVYGLEPSGKFLPPAKLAVLVRMPEATETRKRLEKLFADELEAGIAPADAHQGRTLPLRANLSYFESQLSLALETVRPNRVRNRPRSSVLSRNRNSPSMASDSILSHCDTERAWGSRSPRVRLVVPRFKACASARQNTDTADTPFVKVFPVLGQTRRLGER